MFSVTASTTDSTKDTKKMTTQEGEGALQKGCDAIRNITIAENIASDPSTVLFVLKQKYTKLEIKAEICTDFCSEKKPPNYMTCILGVNCSKCLEL